MTNRSPVAVLLLPIITLGIYSLVWLVKTKREMNELVTPKVPTTWLMIVPIANFVYLWKFSAAVTQVTKGAAGQGTAFALMLLLGPIGQAVVQSWLNKAAA
jgi:hypothetical protein